MTDSLELALVALGCDTAKVVHRPRLLSDNGSSYVAGDLADWTPPETSGSARCGVIPSP